MDRGKSFRILGLSESATKDQVEAAYAKKVARYKGPDYAEEPAYVERKLTELHQAYVEARDFAKSGPNTYHLSRIERDEKKNRGSFDGKKEGKTSKKKLDLKMPELKMPDFSEMKKKFNDAFPDNEIFQDPKKPDGEGMDVLNGMEENADCYAPTEPDSKSDQFMGTLISIAVALIIFFVGSCDGSDNSSYDENWDESSYSYIYDQDQAYVTEADEKIIDLADRSYSLLIDTGENNGATTYEETQSGYQDQAQLFVKNYFGEDYVKDTTAILYERYPSFSVPEDAEMAEQLDAIFAFYGFAPLSSAVWYSNPYTGSRIESYADYLDYLNQFYDKQ